MLLKTKSSFSVRLIIIISTTLAMAESCGSSEQEQKPMPTQNEINRGMEAINRQMMLEEDAVIEAYIERRGWSMNKSGTGIRYEIYESGPEGPTAKEGQVAKVNYVVSLIDGTEIYSSDEQGSRSFMIGQDNVESGIHEAITYLKVGDKAHIILPSYRAHGLTGDNDKIPPRSTVIYDLELLELN